MSEQPINNGVPNRTKGNKDIPLRPRWSGVISQELQVAYMKQVSTFPILTPDEERRWTLLYHDARQNMHDILNNFPLLVLDAMQFLLDSQNTSRLDNYFNFGSTEDDVNDSSLRQQYEYILINLNKIPRNTLAFSPNIKHEHFWKECEKLEPRSLFYDLMLEMLCANENYKTYMDTKHWEIYKPQLDSAKSKMQEASKILVERNLRLVISIASHYAGNGIALADLVQEGNMGLMHSVERFNCMLGHRFTTYASYWIRQAITKYITNHSRIIRMPANTVSLISSIRQTEQHLLNQNGMLPSPEDIAAQLNISATKVRALQKMTQQPLSLQSILDDDTTLEETIPDSSSNSMQETPDSESLQFVLHEVLNILNEREQMVIKLRYGLDDEKRRTLSEISQELGLSSERVRQIENAAIRKLRIPEVIKKLEDFQK